MSPNENTMVEAAITTINSEQRRPDLGSQSVVPDLATSTGSEAALELVMIGMQRQNETMSLHESDQLATDMNPDAVLAAAVEALGRRLHVARAYFGEINAACDTIDIVLDWTDGSVPGVRGQAPFLLDSEPVQRMLREGFTAVDDIDAIEMDHAHREWLRADSTIAWICVPLMRGDQPVALIGVAHPEPRVFTPEDVEYVGELGAKTWQALAHARTLRRLRESQAILQRLDERFDCEADAAVAPSIAVETLGQSLGVSRSFYAELDDTGERLRIVASWTDGPLPMDANYPFELESRSTQAMLRDGYALEEDLDRAEMDDGVREHNRAYGILAWIVVPLLRGGRLVALMGVSNRVPRRFEPADVELVRDVGERTWQTVVQTDTVRRLRDSQTAMDARAEHERFYRAVGDQIREDAHDATILFKVAAMLAAHLNADSATFHEPDPNDPLVHDVYRHVDQSVVHRTAHRVILPAVGTAYFDRLRDGHPRVARDVRGERDPDAPNVLTEQDVGAFITVPIVENGRIVVVLSVQTNAARNWSEADVHLVGDLANRVWSTIASVRTKSMLAEREANQAFLIAWNDAIRDESDPERIISSTIHQLGERFTPFNVSFSELDDDGVTLSRVRVWHGGTTYREARKLPLTAFGETLAAIVAESHYVAIDDIDDDARLSPAERTIWREYDIRGVLIAPIFSQGRIVALLTMQADRPRHWTASECQVLRDLADRVWSTIIRVRAEAELAERQATQAFLIDWSDAIRDETDPERVIAETIERLGKRYAPYNASFSEIEAGGTMLERVRTWHAGVTYRDARRWPLTAFGETLVAQFRDHPCVAIDDMRSDPRIGADKRAVHAEHGIVAMLIAPVVVLDRVVALLVMQSDHPRRWTAVERSVLCDLADRVWSKVERTRAEIGLARSRAALGRSEKMASLGAVLAGISHELNNPLAIVTAQAQLIAHIAEGTDLADRARHVHEAGDRCARIIQSFLAIARQTPPNRNLRSLGDIIERASHQVSLAAADQATALLVQVEPDLPEVLVDIDQIHQLLVNLLVNAQHAVAAVDPRDRRIVVRATRRDPDLVIIDVVDTGPGIAETARERIFEPFFTTKPTGGGTGMGLALAQGVAELHGGALNLMPSERGAHFRVTLPAAG